jgi:hypothetical protein
VKEILKPVCGGSGARVIQFDPEKLEDSQTSPDSLDTDLNLLKLFHQFPLISIIKPSHPYQIFSNLFTSTRILEPPTT